MRKDLSRNVFLRLSGLEVGVLIAACILEEDARAAGSGSAGIQHSTRRIPHLNPRAKAVIQLVQNGGPSQMDLFDPKP